jgi:hypothetical protein
MVYTGDKVNSDSEFLDKAAERFTIKLDPNRTKFVYIRFRWLVLDKYYPIFTLLGIFKHIFFIEICLIHTEFTFFRSFHSRSEFRIAFDVC